MLSSLPVIHPRDSYAHWYAPSSTFSYGPPPAASQYTAGDTSHGHSDPSQVQSRNNSNQNVNPRRPTNAAGPLRQLEMEEASIQNRKTMIQLFGATWIKPPGLLKTYQGELDEKAEREEAAQREQDEMTNATFMQEGGVEGEDLDLDADIPEGSEVGDEFEEDEEDDLREDDEYGDLEEELEDEEVDLDAEIPEAEAERLWSDSDEEPESEEVEDEGEGDGDVGIHEMDYASTGDITISTGEDSDRTDDESPQPAMFSHDERYLDAHDMRQPRAYGLDWRAARARRHPVDDSMDMDSD